MKLVVATLLSLFFIVAWFAMGCGGEENEGHSVIVQFPNPAQAYRDATQTLNLSIIAAENAATCRDFLAGVKNPGDDGYTVIGSASIPTPFTEPIPSLKVLKKDTRTRLLFIEGKDGVGNILLRGCIEMNPKDNLQTLTLSLEEACPIGIYCTSACQNGLLEPGETCDTTIAAGAAGACPTQCDDGNICTRDKLQNAGTCQAVCVNTPITECIRDDGCCPDGANCNNNTDNDCPAVCGNGVVEAESGETCDTAIAAGEAGACPTSCDDGNKCTTDTLQNAGSCQAVCDNTPIVPCCGNGIIETGEDCDPPNGTDCPNFCKLCVGLVDITGTWIARVTTTGTIIEPYPPDNPLTGSTIDLVQRLVVTKSDSNRNTRFDICSLNNTSPSPITSVTDYSTAVLGTFTTHVTEADQCVQLGSGVTFPTFVINSGWDGAVTSGCTCPRVGATYPPTTDPPDECCGAIDSDGDGVYGITSYNHFFNDALRIYSYNGMTITTKLNGMTIQNPTSIIGSIDLSMVGYWFGSTAGATGEFSVMPDSTAVPITLIKLAGDVSCSEVLTHCAGATCVP
jgi:hypothetical protein